MRESWVSFFWSGAFPDTDGLVTWQKYLKDQKSEFNVRLWTDELLFSQFKERFSFTEKNANEVIVRIDNQEIVITNFQSTALKKAQNSFKKSCNAFLLLQTYKMYEHASDWARLLILHEAPSFYCDFDIKPNFENKKLQFPKSMDELIELSNSLGLDLHQMDIFFRRDAQVVLSFSPDPIKVILRINELQVNLEKVELEIKAQLAIVDEAKKLFEKDVKEKNSERYIQFQQLILKIKKAFITKTTLCCDIHASDPYKIKKGIDNSAGFIYCHGLFMNTKKQSPHSLMFFNPLLESCFLNTIQDRFPALYSWQNPQILKVVKKWHDAHIITISAAKEIDFMGSLSREADEINAAFKAFSQGNDDALNRISEIEITDLQLKAVLVKHALLTPLNKVDVLKLKDDGLEKNIYGISQRFFIETKLAQKKPEAPLDKIRNFFEPFR